MQHSYACGTNRAATVTPILKESRIFNMHVITDTGYINTTMWKYNIIEI